MVSFNQSEQEEEARRAREQRERADADRARHEYAMLSMREQQNHIYDLVKQAENDPDQKYFKPIDEPVRNQAETPPEQPPLAPPANNAIDTPPAVSPDTGTIPPPPVAAEPAQPAINVVYFAPDHNGAFTGAEAAIREQAANDPNTVIIDISGKTPEQIRAETEAISAGQPINATLLAHGYQNDGGKDGEKGGFQYNDAGYGDDLMSYDHFFAHALPDNTRSVFIASCEGGSAHHSAAHLPNGAQLFTLANESTVGWNIEIEQVIRQGVEDNNLSGEYLYSQAQDTIDRNVITARNEHYANKNGKQVGSVTNQFTTNKDQIMSEKISIGGVGTIYLPDQINAGKMAVSNQAIAEAKAAFDGHTTDTIDISNQQDDAQIDAIAGKMREGTLHYSSLSDRDKNIALSLAANTVSDEHQQQTPAPQKENETTRDNTAPDIPDNMLASLEAAKAAGVCGKNISGCTDQEDQPAAPSAATAANATEQQAARGA